MKSWSPERVGLHSRRLLAHAGVRAALLTAALACSEARAIRVAPGSTASRLTFEIDTEAVRGATAAFRVDACSAAGVPPQAHWLARGDGTWGSVGRIEYGAPPAGWHSVQGPRPLAPGCYRAAIARATPLEIDIHEDGSVSAR